MLNSRIGVVFVGLLVAACNTPPPRTWLRFQPAGSTNWSMDGSGLLTGRLHGADVQVNLNHKQTRIEVLVQNGSSEAVEMRMGPEAGAPRAAIGEVLLRPLGGPPGAGGPDIMPYNAMQAVRVEAGWRGVFYIDAPLGRETTLGQYFVLTVEARNAAGVCERRTLPLVAANAGTMPADGR